MRFKSTSGSLFNGLVAIGAGLTVIFPGVRLIGVVLVIIGFLFLVFDGHFESGHLQFGSPMTLGERLRNVWPRYLIVLLAIGGVSLSAWYFWPIPVYASFEGVYLDHKQELGSPLRPAVNSIGAYEVWMQHAYVIWMIYPGIMCGFGTESIRKPICTNDAFHAYSTEPELFNEAYVKGKLKLSKSEYWPRGSIAYYLINQPQKWGWMGKDLKQCQLEGGSGISYQDFEKGRIYGVFRIASDAADLTAGIAFVVLNDGSWSRVTVSDAPPKISRCDGD
jgi:hypothetical protein